ncbi:hypothetical protein [Nostoc sp.]|uniref:hypothetical protein n=1 Tax=Nostoc sp. TaxID=1180 RepID=UPI002FFCBC9F
MLDTSAFQSVNLFGETRYTFPVWYEMWLGIGDKLLSLSVEKSLKLNQLFVN